MKAAALPHVQLRASKAFLGAVVRDIARQAKITVIYPVAFDSTEYTGDLAGAADAILDALARRSDLRFQFSDGVGLIGKPVPGDRAVAVLRVPFADAARVVQPLLSEGSRVTESSGWLFMTDRTEVLQKVVAAIHDMRLRSYAVQLLELFTTDGFAADIAGSAKLNLSGHSLSSIFDSQVSASLLDQGAYLGRTWTAVVSEGDKNQFFVGGSERRDSTTANDKFLSTSTNVVQTGWHWDFTVQEGRLLGSISYDATDAMQYRVDTALPSPGLFLVHSSDVSEKAAGWGFPRLFSRSSRTKRWIWVRFSPLGNLLQAPPRDGVDSPAMLTRPVGPPLLSTGTSAPRPIGPAPVPARRQPGGPAVDHAPVPPPLLRAPPAVISDPDAEAAPVAAPPSPVPASAPSAAVSVPGEPAAPDVSPKP
ncbi:MAG TPA: hypothetical protein VHU40_03055 [Polyangia bacterium]|jgi:hypothetical protein|nr:hypothetical protein [Polyangia bacterium]